jgi:glutathione S-transferase
MLVCYRSRRATMILVGQYDSPYVRRVAISLHLLGFEFERNRLSIFADAERMREINPLGRIPSLVLDDGEVLIDSAAILDHLDQTVGPARALLPTTGPERRGALQTIALATGIIDKVGAVTYEVGLRPADKVYQPWIDRCRTQVASGLAVLERRIAGQSADRLTQPMMQPAITSACLVAHLRRQLPDAIAGGMVPALQELAAQCEATPPFRATVAADDETMPDRP